MEAVNNIFNFIYIYIYLIYSFTVIFQKKNTYIAIFQGRTLAIIFVKVMDFSSRTCNRKTKNISEKYIYFKELSMKWLQKSLMMSCSIGWIIC